MCIELQKICFKKTATFALPCQDWCFKFLPAGMHGRNDHHLSPFLIQKQPCVCLPFRSLSVFSSQAVMASTGLGLEGQPIEEAWDCSSMKDSGLRDFSSFLSLLGGDWDEGAGNNEISIDRVCGIYPGTIVIIFLSSGEDVFTYIEVCKTLIWKMWIHLPRLIKGDSWWQCGDCW